MTQAPLSARVPVNLITGFLGVGKTTAIRHWLATKPAGEFWAVLVNEFGEIGIDGAAMQAGSDEMKVVEVPGGCICCTTSPMLQVSLTRLLRERRPDRLLIEPSGLGHPAGIIDLLSEPLLAAVLDIRATITLLDPRHLSDSRYTLNTTWRDQLALADVLVANKCDRADAEQIDQFQRMAAAMFPPKLAAITTSQARIDPTLLDLQRPTSTPGRYRPKRVASSQSDTVDSIGWIWPATHIFSVEALAALFDRLGQLEGIALQRAKGVFHTNAGWLLFNWVDGEANAVDIAWRQDSRCELIGDAMDGGSGDWSRLEAELLNCLRTSATV